MASSRDITINPFSCSFCRNEDLDVLHACTSKQCAQSAAYCYNWCKTCWTASPCNQPNHKSCWEYHFSAPPGHFTLLPDLAHRPVTVKHQLLVEDILGMSDSDAQVQHLNDRAARWFIADPKRDNGEGVLYVMNRFDYLCPQGQGGHPPRQHPALVSFIGSTGSGKSSLIRGLAKVNPDEKGQKLGVVTADCPVARSTRHTDFAKATTAGVHLYKDPFRGTEEEPLLFADCEGFSAGAAVPEALRAGAPTSESQDELDDRVQQRVIIKLSSYARAPAAGIEDLYARFLYAFSDVVCFVTRTESEITMQMQKLLEWAARSHRTSINETPKRTLIIIWNQLTIHKPGHMDEKVVTEVLFHGCGEVWKNSPELRDIYNEANKPENPPETHILTTRDFLLKYFQSIRVCYVPVKTAVRADEFLRQHRVLRTIIEESSRMAVTARRTSWMQRSTQDLYRLLPLAFEHFATRDDPFDFYLAARRDEPRPREMEDHIMNLLRHMKDAGVFTGPCFSSIVALSLANDSLSPRSLLVNPKDLWEGSGNNSSIGYRDICERGIRMFWEEHARCGFSMNGRRCCLLLIGHASGATHRDEKGLDIQHGQFDPRNYQEIITLAVDEIGVEFQTQLLVLCGADEPRKPPAPNILAHRKSTLTGRSGDLTNIWKQLRSNKTCFACLKEVPDHVLPCLHTFCETCVRDFGKGSDTKAGEWVMEECPLCRSSWVDPQKIQTRPLGAGVRLLTLDGGGVRGILEIAILKEIERKTGLGLPILSYFDLVTGTSTGGIISLGLVMKGLDLDTMAEKFKEISKATFQFKRGIENQAIQVLTGSRWVQGALLIAGLLPSLYRTAPLREELSEALGRDMTMFGAPKVTGKQRKTRVAVTSVKNSGHTSTIITNYNHRILAKAGRAKRERAEPGSPVDEDEPDDWDQLERDEKDEDELKAWEAGLATAAAPFYFKSYKKAVNSTETEYWDGGITENNPVRVATKEYHKIWPGSHLDILVSIGTGITEERDRLPGLLGLSALRVLVTSYLENISGETIWGHFRKEPEYDRSVYHRLNLYLGKEGCRLDEWGKMESLEAKLKKAMEPPGEDSIPVPTPLSPNTSIGTGLNPAEPRQYSAQTLRNRVGHIAQCLVASLFFFRPQKYEADFRSNKVLHKLHGVISCRLRAGEPKIRNLIPRLDSFHVTESSNGQFATAAMGKIVPIKDELRTAVMSGKPFEIPYTLETFEPSSREQMIWAKFGGESRGVRVRSVFTEAISGFPRTLNNLKAEIFP
ncbi:MAG: hypothetical protein M1839_005668 [Geoglossum umbratile]|nr:MAG: hypothetical protein M1839_005668 [Geoglossum umbratile]